MLANLAVGYLETNSIAKGIEAADAMCKMASVKLAKTSIVARGKYIILITGPVGEVESSLRAGREMMGKTLVDEVLIRNVHSQVIAALDTRMPVEVLGAVGIVEIDVGQLLGAAQGTAFDLFDLLNFRVGVVSV